MTTTPRAAAVGLLATAMVGGSVPVSGLLVDYPLLGGQAVRYAVGAALLALWMLARGAPIGLPRPGDLPALLGVAVVGMLGFNACMITAQRHADPGLVAAVLGGSPLVLALVGPVLARERPAARAVVGAAVVVAGVVVLSGGGSWTGPGLLLAVLTMLCEAGFTLLAVGLVRRRGGLAASLWTHAAAAVLCAAAASAVDDRWRAPTAGEAAAIVVVAALTVAAACGWFAAVDALGADRAGVLIGAMPVAGLAVSVALGAEPLRAGAAAGVLLVAAGCVVGLRVTARRGPSAARPAPRPAAPR